MEIILINHANFINPAVDAKRQDKNLEPNLSLNLNWSRDKK